MFLKESIANRAITLCREIKQKGYVKESIHNRKTGKLCREIEKGLLRESLYTIAKWQ